MQKPFTLGPKQKPEQNKRICRNNTVPIFKNQRKCSGFFHKKIKLSLADRHSSSGKLADFHIFQKSDLQSSTTTPRALSQETRIANEIKHNPVTHQNQPQHTS